MDLSFGPSEMKNQGEDEEPVFNKEGGASEVGRHQAEYGGGRGKEEFQGGRRDHLDQMLLLVKFNGHLELTIGFSNMKVTGQIDKSSFKGMGGEQF